MVSRKTDLKEEITYSDLSASLRFLVVSGWIIVGLFGFWFLVGFISAMLGVPIE